jgi:hypothetical protein
MPLQELSYNVKARSSVNIFVRGHGHLTHSAPETSATTSSIEFFYFLLDTDVLRSNGRSYMYHLESCATIIR